MSIIVKIIAQLVGLFARIFLKKITPSLRESLVEFVEVYSKDASETKNNWDDYLAYVMQGVFVVKLDKNFKAIRKGKK